MSDKPGIPVWRAVFHDDDGRRTSFFYCVEEDGIVTRCPRCFNHLDGMTHRNAKLWLQKIDPDAQFSITSIQADAGRDVKED